MPTPERLRQRTLGPRLAIRSRSERGNRKFPPRFVVEQASPIPISVPDASLQPEPVLLFDFLIPHEDLKAITDVLMPLPKQELTELSGNKDC